MSLDINLHQKEFTLCASLPAFPISAPDADDDCLLRVYVEKTAGLRAVRRGLSWPALRLQAMSKSYRRFPESPNDSHYR